MDNEPYRRANWANITMFQFMSDNELPPPDQKHEEDPEMGTVIFDWNMPGSNAEVSYRKESGTKVSPPTNIQPSNVGNVSYVFEGWYDAPTGGNKIGDTVEVPDNKLSLIHISEPTRRTPISYAVFCLKKKKKKIKQKKKIK